MSEYINREELRAAMQHIYNDPTCPMHTVAEIEQIIDCAPTVDAEVVVRCRDCKHCYKEDRRWWCMIHDDIYAEEDYFCASGERKDEDK